MTLIRICPSYAIEAFGGGEIWRVGVRPCQAPTLGSLAAAARLPPSPPAPLPPRQTSAGGHSPENVAAADLEEPAGAAGSAAAAAWAIRKRFGDCGTVPTAVAIRSRHSRTPGLRVY